jgi:hypothetical protein
MNMNFLQKYFNGVFELPSPTGAQKRNEHWASKEEPRK